MADEELLRVEVRGKVADGLEETLRVGEQEKVPVTYLEDEGVSDEVRDCDSSQEPVGVRDTESVVLRVSVRVPRRLKEGEGDNVNERLEV